MTSPPFILNDTTRLAPFMPLAWPKIHTCSPDRETSEIQNWALSPMLIVAIDLNMNGRRQQQLQNLSYLTQP